MKANYLVLLKEAILVNFSIFKPRINIRKKKLHNKF